MKDKPYQAGVSLSSCWGICRLLLFGGETIREP